MIVDSSNGIITVYNIQDSPWEFRVYDYVGTATTDFVITNDGLTEVDLIAKSAEIEYLWSQDNEPVVGFDVELFYNNLGTWESIENYTTDVNGKVLVDSIILLERKPPKYSSLILGYLKKIRLLKFVISQF